jgi:hypothetical protein
MPEFIYMTSDLEILTCHQLRLIVGLSLKSPFHPSLSKFANHLFTKVGFKIYY